MTQRQKDEALLAIYRSRLRYTYDCPNTPRSRKSAEKYARLLRLEPLEVQRFQNAVINGTEMKSFNPDRVYTLAKTLLKGYIVFKKRFPDKEFAKILQSVAREEGIPQPQLKIVATELYTEIVSEAFASL